ncbi:MAG TPA: ATP-binding cassette domain-containing protein [Paludibacteraceae bacterium]|nr:ATP-binding cassette domain-containing protein [Paludibacteraceae bacterium]
MSITISHLSKSFGKQKVLNNISFEIKQGDIVGFLGPNGAGKTTTMKIITGALPYREGSVKVDGWEVKEQPLKTKSLIGYLPEQNPLYAEMYVKEYLLFVASLYGLRKNKNEKIDKLIDVVGLRPEFKKRIGQLSKGYRQRVGLAQALIHDPKVLILDEPTTGLDPNQLEEIRELIRSLGKNKTVLLSTHILQEIKAICNRVIVINKGEIVADYENFSKINNADKNHFQYEIEFSKAVEMEKLKNLSNIISIKTIHLSHFILSSSSDIRSELFNFAVENENPILTLKPIEKSLEEIFKELTTE